MFEPLPSDWLSAFSSQVPFGVRIRERQSLSSSALLVEATASTLMTHQGILNQRYGAGRGI